MAESPAQPAARSARPRVEWVDAARCLAMFIVIWLHGGCAPAFVGPASGGSICLFFILAGYFTPQNPLKCLKRAGLLALAWLLWSALSAGFSVLPGLAEWSWERAVGIGARAYNTPLWFLRNLAIFQGVVGLLLLARILPRFSWLLTLALAAAAYDTSLPQHESLRWDTLWYVTLGFSLKSVPLERLTELLRRHAALLATLCAAALYLDWHATLCYHSLPVDSLAYAGLYAAAAYWLCRLLPAPLRALPVHAGGSMIFTYAAHSLFLAPVYYYGIRWGWNTWLPLLLIPLLTALHRLLAKYLPRTTALLCAK